MQCPNCHHALEIVIKEPESQQQQIIQPALPQAVEQPVMQEDDGRTRLLQPSGNKNKITDDEFLNAQRILSLAAQGNLLKQRY